MSEQAAIDDRDPAMLIRLLTRKAERADHDGDMPLAEASWVRVLNLTRIQGDHAGTCTARARLSDLYRRWGRWHRAMDVLTALLDACGNAGDDDGGLSRDATLPLSWLPGGCREQRTHVARAALPPAVVARHLSMEKNDGQTGRRP